MRLNTSIKGSNTWHAPRGPPGIETTATVRTIAKEEMRIDFGSSVAYESIASSDGEAMPRSAWRTTMTKMYDWKRHCGSDSIVTSAMMRVALSASRYQSIDV